MKNVKDMVEDLMDRLSRNEQERCSPVVTHWGTSKERDLLIAAIKRR